MTEKTRVNQYIIKEMIDFYEKFQAIPIEARQALEKAYQDSRPDSCHYSSGQFTYSSYTWRIDALKAIQDRLTREAARVAKAQEARRWR